jgi:hypothetical protein
MAKDTLSLPSDTQHFLVWLCDLTCHLRRHHLSNVTDNDPGGDRIFSPPRKTATHIYRSNSKASNSVDQAISTLGHVNGV